MRFTDLIFDLYGTLVDIHTDENDLVWDKTALYFGFHGAPCTGCELKAAFAEAMKAREAKAGQSYECFPDIPVEQVMTALFEARGIVDHAEELGFNAAQLFRIASLDYIRVYPGAAEALAELRRRGFRLWLLSNAQRAFTAYELRLLGLDSQFDGIYLSSDYGCRKPDVLFYRALIDAQHLDPGHCLMIGNDRSTDIAGAKACGLATLYMHTALTPADQAEADPAMHPASAPNSSREYEFEGDNWAELVHLIADL